MKVRMRRRITFAGGSVLAKGQIVEVDGRTIELPTYDRAHYKATREHRWLQQPYYRHADVVFLTTDAEPVV